MTNKQKLAAKVKINKGAKQAATAKGCHLAAIKKNNMKDKNKDKDRWISGIRSSYESVFSKQRRRTRYCGIGKNQFSAIMEAICFNLRRLTVLDPPDLVLS